jgi:hypothetical protein
MKRSNCSPLELSRHFRLLEIHPDASYDEAREAYLDMVHVWHPDKYELNSRLQLKATEKLKEINNAWKNLEAYYAEEKQRATREGRPGERSRLQVRCRECGTVNKVPEPLPVGNVKCGACGAKLPGNHSAPPARNVWTGSGSLSKETPGTKRSLSVPEVAASISVGIIVMLILFLMKNTLF